MRTRTLLTPDDIRAIRRAAEEGNTQQFLAQKYGVSQPAISYIVSRKRWRDVV